MSREKKNVWIQKFMPIQYSNERETKYTTMWGGGGEIYVTSFAEGIIGY